MNLAAAAASCPYLASLRDATTFYAYPSASNRCGRFELPASLPGSYQARFFLVARPQGGPPASPARAGGVPPAARRGGGVVGGGGGGGGCVSEGAGAGAPGRGRRGGAIRYPSSGARARQRHAG